MVKVLPVSLGGDTLEVNIPSSIMTMVRDDGPVLIGTSKEPGGRELFVLRGHDGRRGNGLSPGGVLPRWAHRRSENVARDRREDAWQYSRLQPHQVPDVARGPGVH